MKFASIIAVLLVMCLLFVGCKGQDKPEQTQPQATSAEGEPVETEPQEITFSRNGVTLTLPGDFSDHSEAAYGKQYAFLYAAPYVGVLGIQDVKEDLSESITDLAAYAAYQAAQCGGEAVEKDGLWTLSYEDLSQNEPQYYVCAFYETEGEFWSIKSYCPSDLFEDNQSAMWSYVTAAVFQ